MESLYNYIDIDKRKGFTGAFIGLFLLVVCCTWYNFFIGILFAVLFSVSGFMKIKVQSKKWCILLNIFASFCVLVSTWLGSMAMLGVVARMGISIRRLIMNFIIIMIVCLVFMIMTANWRISLIIGTTLLMVLCLANGFVFQFRGKELAPLDFLSIKTAASVAGKYVPKLTHSMLYGIVGWFWTIFMLYSVPKITGIKKSTVRLRSVATEAILIILLCISTGDIKIKLWDSQGTRINGYFLNFFLELRDSAVDKPQTYSPVRVKEILDKHKEPEFTPVTKENAGDGELEYGIPQLKPKKDLNAAKKDDYPNIIVIMDESFADFSVVGDNFSTNIPVTPFIDSLQENTIKGYAMSSVFGGNTANSEFEFLTGMSMAFLPDSSVPYQQYINDEIYSLPWVLRSYGYNCVSTHPYHESGWSREHIYPRLGFEESTFLDDYIEPELVREYVSDRETFKFILNYLENAENDKPLFMFGITMQNHGGYSYKGDNFTPEIILEGVEDVYPEAEQYLSLTHITDSAVEYLITELSNFPEDTVVLFFGDHFPNIKHSFFESIHGGKLESPEEKMLLYKVPFFMWANFDIPEADNVNTSLNYLSVELLKTAGITLSPFYKFLDECKNVLPALNLYGLYSVADEAFVTYSETSPVEQDWLEEYAILQYNNLIDSKNRDELFKSDIVFGEEIPDTTSDEIIIETEYILE